MKHNERINPVQLEIDLASKQEPQLFRWFMSCLLFGKPIQQEIAARAYRRLVDVGITNLEQLSAYDWNTLVRLLDEAKYVRYDFSTATKLIDIATSVKREYGSVYGLIEASRNASDLTKRLLKYKGIGHVTASIFVSQIAPIWFRQDAHDTYDIARRVVGILRSHKFEAYFVGGAVRDMLLEIPPKDYDIVTSATPEQIVAIPEFAGAKYNDPAQAFGVTRVRFEHETIEIATFRKDIGAHAGRRATKVAFTDLRGDVLRRDFTINALALDPFTGQVIDYVGGVDDVRYRLVRFIGDPARRIQEDPLRILRAIRLRNYLGFSYHPRTTLGIRRSAARGQIAHIATDRIRDELTRMLMHPSRRQAIIDLDDFDILAHILPEVTAGKGIMQQPEFHAEGDVWLHQLLILDYLPAHSSRRLVWAALLHDIGKPATRMMPLGGSGSVRFDRHYAVGAELAKTVLRRLRFSNQDIRDITWMIYNHMSIDDLPAMRPSHRQRMMDNPAFADLLELHRADASASWRSADGNDVPDFSTIERMWSEYRSHAATSHQKSLKHDLGIDGNWLLSHFGRDFDMRGPAMGRVLRELSDWYIDEGVVDMNAYIRRARHLLANEKTGKRT